MKIKPVKRGYAGIKTGMVTIPEWVLGIKCSRQAYQVYYVTHEVTHFRIGLKHDAKFKQVEAEVLSKVFAVTIRRHDRHPRPWRPPSDHGTYPDTLVDKATGEVLWKKFPKPDIYSWTTI